LPRLNNIKNGGMSMKQWWNEADRESQSTQKKTSPGSDSSIKNPTRTGLE